jgi:putative phage-type endonuclease
MKLVSLEQRTPEWREFRKRGLGSSHIPSIMGCDPYNSIYDTWAKITGKKTEKKTTLPMNKGTDSEKEALKWLCTTTGKVYKPIVVQHKKYPFLYASIDAYCEDDHSLVEIKTPFGKDMSVKPNHIVQTLYQDECVNATNRSILIWDYENKNGELHPQEKHVEQQREIIEKAVHFWEYNIVLDMPPDIKKSDLVTTHNPELSEMIKQYLSRALSIKELEEENKILRETILTYCNYEHGYSLDDGKIVLCEGRKSFDTKQMLLDGMDLSKYEKISKPSYMIRK